MSGGLNFMKIFQNKNLFKKLIIVLLFITIFSFCMPKVSRASVGGDLMDAVMDLFVGVGDGINTVLSKMILQTDGSFIVVDTETNGVAKILGIIVAAAVIIGGIVLIAAAPASLAVVSAIFTVVKAGVVAGVVTFAVTSYLSDATFGEKVVLPSIRLTPYEIFTNQIPLFDVDFFSPMTDLKTESSSKVSKNALKSGISSEDVAKEFGDEVALLVDGVTKLTQLNYQHDKIEVQAENLRKMFLAMAKDIRVILIKLADRLHNMRTMQYQSPAKQIEKSRETMEIYAPIAHRLGISKIKVELDDLSMKYLMPDVYNDLVEQVNLNRPGREAFIKSIIKEVGMHISNAGIEAEIDGRVKHFSQSTEKWSTRIRRLTRYMTYLQ